MNAATETAKQEKVRKAKSKEAKCKVLARICALIGRRDLAVDTFFSVRDTFLQILDDWKEEDVVEIEKIEAHMVKIQAQMSTISEKLKQVEPPLRDELESLMTDLKRMIIDLKNEAVRKLTKLKMTPDRLGSKPRRSNNTERGARHIFQILGEDILKTIAARAKKSLFYALMIDESSDLSRKEQCLVMSIS